MTSMFAQLIGFTMLLSIQNPFASLHTTSFTKQTHVMSKSGDNIGLVCCKIYTCKDVSLKHDPLYCKVIPVLSYIPHLLKCSCTPGHVFQSLCKVSSPYLLRYAWTTTRKISKTDFLEYINYWICHFLGTCYFDDTDQIDMSQVET